MTVLETKIDLVFLLSYHQKTDVQLNKRFINNDDLDIMAIMKTMITTVIMLKSLIIKMIMVMIIVITMIMRQ